MLKKISIITISLLTMLLSVKTNYSQTQNMGLFLNDTANTFKGYTLFAPKHDTMTYLINNAGQKVHEWSASRYAPGQTVYLLNNGHLLRTCMMQNQQLGTGGGEGGRIEEYTWNDSLVWYTNFSTTTYMQHHDARKLPNGNIIMLVVEKKTVAEVISAGFDTSMIQEPDFHNHQMFLPDAVYEIQPTYPSGGNIVWEWHVWDHLIQSHDATKSNYGVPSAHPELIDAAGDHKALPVFWNHMNSIDYNPALDQILLSIRGNSEVWIIDHSTTTAQAASHTGGNHNKGGDLLYRFGNPVCYGAGTTSDQKLYQQHDAEWVSPTFPGAGNITVFNNGVGLNYSTIDEFTPPVDTSGNYAYTTGTAYGPSSFYWTYNATPPTSLYAEDISGAYRMPNGNTLIDDGPLGTFTEVTQSGQIVWKYVNPVAFAGPLYQGDSIPVDTMHAGEMLNAVFRIYRYPLNYSAFTGQDLTPQGFIELYPTSILNLNTLPTLQIYPNPFTNKISVRNTSGKEYYQLLNSMGQIIWAGANINREDFSSLTSGLYVLKINTKNTVQTFKLIKQ